MYWSVLNISFKFLKDKKFVRLLAMFDRIKLFSSTTEIRSALCIYYLNVYSLSQKFKHTLIYDNKIGRINISMSSKVADYNFQRRKHVMMLIKYLVSVLKR